MTHQTINAKTSLISGSYSYTKDSLHSMIACRVQSPIDAAAIFTISPYILNTAQTTKQQYLDNLYRGYPSLFAISQTSLGRLGSIALPIYADDVYQDTIELLNQTVHSIELAKSLGAKTISLTGLIPSGTGYGLKIIDAIPSERRHALPIITTGHDVTVSAFIMQLENVLSKTLRNISEEDVCFLGLGSIGTNIFESVLTVLDHPKSITLCDPYRSKNDILGYESKLRNKYDYSGEINTVHCDNRNNDQVYSNSIILSATNEENSLNIGRLKSGTIIIDDSAPHCFEVSEAYKRIECDGDLILCEAGLINLPYNIDRLIWDPFNVKDTLLKFIELEPSVIMGCEYSALLTSKVSEIHPTVGVAVPESCYEMYKKLKSMDISSGPIKLDSYVFPKSYIENFSRKYGFKNSLA